jgi:cytochrome bd-type quinol oxidase subunit 1
MSEHDQVKKVKRIAAIVYLLIMAVIMGGTYWSEQNKKQSMKVAERESQALLMPDEKPVIFSDSRTPN